MLALINIVSLSGYHSTMSITKVLLALCLVSISLSTPVQPPQQSRADSEEYDDDPLGYFAEQASSFFEDFLKEDNNAKVKIIWISN